MRGRRVFKIEDLFVMVKFVFLSVFF